MIYRHWALHYRQPKWVPVSREGARARLIENISSRSVDAALYRESASASPYSIRKVLTPLPVHYWIRKIQWIEIAK